MSFFGELKRRNVFRVGAAYLVAAWALIEVVDTIVSILAAPAWIPQVLVYSVAIGFPVALVLAWVYELTPEGLKATEDTEALEAVRFLGRKVDYAVIGLLVLVVGFLVVENYVLDEPTGTSLESGGGPSIAVLPFRNVSSDPEQDYFSDGISEDLLNLLAKVPDVRVIARSSSFSFRDEEVGIPNIAEQLNVSHVLEGSVRKAGDEVRISVQLVDARAETLWSDSYDRTLDDIFDVQDEIAARVLEQLQVTLLGAAPQADEVDPQAYNLFLQAMGILDERNTPETFAIAEGLLRQALEIERDFARAIVELARLRHQVGSRQWRFREGVPEGVSRREFMVETVRDTRDLLYQALAVDPQHAVAYGWLAWLERVYGGNVVTIARNLERSLELDPTNPFVLRGHFGSLEDLGHAEEAILLGERALARDPLCVGCYHQLGSLYGRAMRFDEAIQSLETARALRPNAPVHDLMGDVLLLKGEAEAALAEYEQAEDDARPFGMALALYDLGRRAEFEAAFMELRETWGDEVPSAVAAVYAYTGDADAAFEWLERMLDGEYRPGWFSIVRNPWFNDLHTDPRWEAVLERLGLDPAQLEALDFQLTLPEYVGGEQNPA